ncbi:MAG: hypothetical protein DRP56_07910 [Planctomycetota bacterium]|nr:MAG: hypothetical protein DRP56_07910 [Planctomycetota bacterium]
MGEQEAVITEEASSETAGATTQCVTVENGSPHIFKPPHQPMMQKVGMFAFPCIFGAIYLAVAIFMIVMLYRFVRAVERIADKVEYCVPRGPEK